MVGSVKLLPLDWLKGISQTRMKVSVIKIIPT